MWQVLRSHRGLCLVLMLVAPLFLWHLDNGCLWEDEGITAALAKYTLKHGIPKAVDGDNLITIEGGRDSNAAGIWTWSPWLPFYVTAVSLAVLGRDTLAARLPFALFGLLCVVALYRLLLRHSHDKAWALTAALLLGLNVPFLLFSRQCRYYALSSLLTLLVLGTYWSAGQRRDAPHPWRWGGFFTPTICSFYLWSAGCCCTMLCSVGNRRCVPAILSAV